MEQPAQPHTQFGKRIFFSWALFICQWTVCTLINHLILIIFSRNMMSINIPEKNCMLLFLIYVKPSPSVQWWHDEALGFLFHMFLSSFSTSVLSKKTALLIFFPWVQTKSLIFFFEKTTYER